MTQEILASNLTSAINSVGEPKNVKRAGAIRKLIVFIMKGKKNQNISFLQKLGCKDTEQKKKRHTL